MVLEGVTQVRHYHVDLPVGIHNALPMEEADRIIDLYKGDYPVALINFRGESSVLDGHDARLVAVGRDESVLVCCGGDCVIRDLTIFMGDDASGIPLVVKGNGCLIERIRIKAPAGRKLAGPPFKATGHACLFVDCHWSPNWAMEPDVGLDGHAQDCGARNYVGL